MQLRYRAITEADFDACVEVLYEADDELSLRRGLPVGPHNPQALLRLFRHIAGVSPERGWLAEQGGRVVGFGSAIGYPGMTFLAFLFVRPDTQARGIGRELLERAMAGPSGRGVCIGSIQPISAALYAHYGMVPRVPMYIFARAARAGAAGASGGTRDANDDSDRRARRAGPRGDRVRAPHDHAWWSAGRRRLGLLPVTSWRLRLRPAGGSPRSGRRPPSRAAAAIRRPADADACTRRRLDAQRPRACCGDIRRTAHAGMRLDGPPSSTARPSSRIDHSATCQPASRCPEQIRPRA